MKLSLSWLREYTPIPMDISSKQLIEDLTLHVAELEDVVDMKSQLENIVVGHVLEVGPHENADKLQVAIVDVGAAGEDVGAVDGKLQIVCGAPNLAVGQYVAVALAGAVVFGGSVTIKKSKIRGTESNGMICAEDEIGLGASHDGIMVLNSTLLGGEFGESDANDGITGTGTDALTSFIGTPLCEALNLDDIILDIDNKAITHRPDLWCHYGFAREFAALYDLKCADEPTTELPTADTGVDAGPYAKDTVKISLKSDDCLRYVGAVVRDVKVEPSPDWLQKRLEACGVRPISNVVDVTNYVMLTHGQPMHAFDLDTLEGDEIIVRESTKGEKFVTLDEQELELPEGHLVIADGNGPVALAGVMGGLATGATDNTTSVLFEAASFAKMPVRQSRITFGIQSESSNRFEKGLNPTVPAVAMSAACKLLTELCPTATVTYVGEAISQTAETTHRNTSQAVTVEQELNDDYIIVVHGDYFRRISGVPLTDTQISELLEKLSFDVSLTSGEFSVTVPYFRKTDIFDKEDLAEEVIRLYGLPNLPAQAPASQIAAPQPNASRVFGWQVRDILTGLGMDEAYTYDFISYEVLGACSIPLDGLVEVRNALTTDATHMAPTLIPNLLRSVELNTKYQEQFSLFRLGSVFTQEEEHLAIAGVYFQKSHKDPYFEIKALVDSLCEALAVSIAYRTGGESSLYHPGRMAELVIGDVVIGIIGELHPRLQSHFDLKDRVSMFEINFAALMHAAISSQSTYTAPSVYQAIDRDVSMFVSDSVQVGDLVAAVVAVDPRIRSCDVFDVYMGDGVPDDQKSVALRYVLQDSTQTLEEADITTVSEAVFTALADIGATIRTQ